jgi:hypothetical protein
MPYDVSGWVEVTGVEAHLRVDGSWQPLLCLDVFALGGDEVSEHLFGLVKSSTHDGLFGGRGAPRDCSRAVARDVEANDAFVARHGEGDFGHSHASWDEVVAALRAPGAPSVAGTAWAHVVRSVELLLDRPIFGRVPYARIVVWANW